jgi:hypothetical protein
VNPETDKLPYEEMDKGDNIDDWFIGEGYTVKGKRLLLKLNNTDQ